MRSTLLLAAVLALAGCTVTPPEIPGGRGPHISSGIDVRLPEIARQVDVVIAGVEICSTPDALFVLFALSTRKTPIRTADQLWLARVGRKLDVGNSSTRILTAGLIEEAKICMIGGSPVISAVADYKPVVYFARTSEWKKLAVPSGKVFWLQAVPNGSGGLLVVATLKRGEGPDHICAWEMTDGEASPISLLADFPISFGNYAGISQLFADRNRPPSIILSVIDRESAGSGCYLVELQPGEPRPEYVRLDDTCAATNQFRLNRLRGTSIRESSGLPTGTRFKTSLSLVWQSRIDGRANLCCRWIRAGGAPSACEILDSGSEHELFEHRAWQGEDGRAWIGWIRSAGKREFELWGAEATSPWQTDGAVGSSGTRNSVVRLLTSRTPFRLAGTAREAFVWEFDKEAGKLVVRLITVE